MSTKSNLDERAYVRWLSDRIHRIAVLESDLGDLAGVSAPVVRQEELDAQMMLREAGTCVRAARSLLNEILHAETGSRMKHFKMEVLDGE